MAMPKSFLGLRKFSTGAKTLVVEFHFLLPVGMSPFLYDADH